MRTKEQRAVNLARRELIPLIRDTHLAIGDTAVTAYNNLQNVSGVSTQERNKRRSLLVPGLTLREMKKRRVLTVPNESSPVRIEDNTIIGFSMEKTYKEVGGNEVVLVRFPTLTSVTMHLADTTPVTITDEGTVMDQRFTSESWTDPASLRISFSARYGHALRTTLFVATAVQELYGQSMTTGTLSRLHDDWNSFGPIDRLS